MADQILTLDQLNTLFQTFVLTVLGKTATVTAWKAYKRATAWTGPVPENPYEGVRIAYPTGGQPAWRVTDNVVALWVREIDDPINRQRDMVSGQARLTGGAEDTDHIEEAAGYTRVNEVMFYCYGPGSYETARKIRSGLLLDEYRYALSRSNVYLVPDIAAPRRAPENFQSQWWERVDLSARFNELVIEKRTVNVVKSVDIHVHDKTGEITAFTAEAEEEA